VVGDLSPEALEVVEARAREVGAPTQIHARDWFVSVADTGTARWVSVTFGADAPKSSKLDFRLGPPGRHQAHNAGVALAMIRSLGLPIADTALSEAADRAWSRLLLPGRLEVVGLAPLRIVDAAHTGASALELARHLETVAPKGAILVLSISADKNIAAVLEPLLGRAVAVVTTCAEPVRSLAADTLAERVAELAPGLELHVEPSVALACAWARRRASAADVVCAAGSVYLAGAARGCLGEAAIAD
jgi:dihydrofolate synthase/folylpolyglutamate synthase